MDFVFIVGVARTGSKIYMSIVNRFSDIDVVGEMHFLAPWYVRNDAVRTLGLERNPPFRDGDAERIVEAMYSGRLNGEFWKQSGPSQTLRNRLADLDRDRLVRAMAHWNRRPEGLLRILLTEHARVAGKRRAGAKFPVDIARVGTLADWFPESKLVHLIRDPRAIYTSMATRDLPGARKPGAPRLIAAARRLPYIAFQYRRAARVHRRWYRSPRYHLSRFEDLVGNPGTFLPRLCGFLDIAYSPEMTSIQRVDSSYPGENRTGIDRSAIVEWRRHILPFEKVWVETVLAREMGLFGYAAR
jgi:hypothetical protein